MGMSSTRMAFMSRDRLVRCCVCSPNGGGSDSRISASFSAGSHAASLVVPGVAGCFTTSFAHSAANASSCSGLISLSSASASISRSKFSRMTATNRLSIMNWPSSMKDVK